MAGVYHATARKVALIFIAGLVVAVILAATLTPQGQALLRDPKSFAASVSAFASDHVVLALAAVVAVYALMSLALMPVWWLQVLVGCAFGMYWGTGLCCTCSAASAAMIVGTSRSLGAEQLREKAEEKLARLHGIMERLGKNGLLTVMAIRLTHVLPFSLSNALLALTPVRKREVFVGTLLGNLPSIAFYVALGAAPGLVKTWEFWAVVAGINLGLLVPLGLRYLKPEWMRKVGIE